MILEILGIAEQETQNEQRLGLKATANGNLRDYAVVDNTYKNGEKSNLHQHYYSFPDYEVKEGEYIVLYTREGNDHREEKTSGDIYHFFFWGLDISVWNANDMAHLLKIVASSDKRIDTKK